MIRSTTSYAVFAVAMFLVAAMPALADSAPDHAPAGSTWIPIVIGFSMLAGVILVNMMGSKRGHRD